MALTLFEDTFVTVTQADSVNSGDSLWAEASEAEKELALSTATLNLNYKSWGGSALSSTQPLAFPRSRFDYWDDALGVLVEVAASSVPLRLQRAVSQLALHSLRYPETKSTYSTTFDRIKLGPLELEDTNTNSSIPVVPLAVDQLIAPLLREGARPGNAWWRNN